MVRCLGFNTFTEELRNQGSLWNRNDTMKLEKIGMEETQDGLPKIAGQFRTDTNKVVFYNQNIQNINYPDMTAKNIAAAVEFCEGLLGQNIDYTTFSDFADLVDNIPTGEMHTIKVVYKKKKDCVQVHSPVSRSTALRMMETFRSNPLRLKYAALHIPP